MPGTLSVLLAILLPSGSGPIPQRIGAKLTYEAILPLQVGIPTDSFTGPGQIYATQPVSWSPSDVRVLKTKLVVTVSDTTRSDSGVLWGLTLKVDIWKPSVRVSLLQRKDSSWTWRTASCWFPVDVEPGFPNRSGNPDKRFFNVDHYGALSLGCTDRYAGTLPWRAQPQTRTPSALYGASPVEWTLWKAFVSGNGGSTPRRFVTDNFEFGVSLNPPSTAYRAGTGWLRVQDIDAPASLKLLEVDGNPIPTDWDPPPPKPVLTPQVRPTPGHTWFWHRIIRSWAAGGSLTNTTSSSRSISDTLLATVLEVRDSADWTVGKFHRRDGVDASPSVPFTLRWNDTGAVEGDVDSAPLLLRQSLVRPKDCLQENACFVGRTSSASNGASGPNAESSNWRSGITWELGIGVTNSGTSSYTTRGYSWTSSSSEWILLFGPDSLPPVTTSLRSTPGKTPRALADLASENPRAAFAIWTLDGTRQELTGANLSRVLPGLRGPVLWSVRLEGNPRTGKHMRP